MYILNTIKVTKCDPFQLTLKQVYKNLLFSFSDNEYKKTMQYHANIITKEQNRVHLLWFFVASLISFSQD